MSDPQDGAAPEATDSGSAVRSDAESQTAADQATENAPAADAQAADAQAADAPAAGPAEADGAADATAAAPGDAPAEGPGGPPSGRRRRKRKQRSFWRELPILIAVALLLAVVIKTFAIQAFWIPSGSMENTLEINDRVLVNKIVYHIRDIHRGDIVVFNGDGSWDPGPIPSNGNIFQQFGAGFASMFGFGHPGDILIKRVIGIPGDRVACCDAQGQLTVNGVPLTEQSYLYPGSAPSLARFNIVVQPGRLWVMGDNRLYSEDSRDHMGDPGGGTVPESAVIGRAFIIIWPLSRWRILPIPATFTQKALNDSDAAGPPSADTEPAAGSDLLTARAEPTGQVVPLALGFVGAIPLTWLQRRARMRLARRRRRGPKDPPRG
ncbi:MAG: signal peptidase I [Streptosporangiaceae bacterium]